MITTLVLLVLSGGAMAALLLLFSYENKQQRRLLAPIRRWCDRAAVALAKANATAARRLSSGTLWYYTQKIFQHVIALCLGILRALESIFDRMQRKQLSRFHPRSIGHADKHLEAMRAYKKETSLSPEARERLRAERLEE